MAIINPDNFGKILKSGVFGSDHRRIFGKLRSQMIADGDLMDISDFAHEKGLSYPAAIMAKLFNELYPWAEDATKGVEFSQRVEDMIKMFMKDFGRSMKSFGEFEYTFETYIIEAISFDKVKTFKDGKPRTKTLRLWAAIYPGDTPENVITFGLRDTKWTGTRTPPLTS